MDLAGFARSLLPFSGGMGPNMNGGGLNALYDPLKLFVIGGTVETSRRLASSAWSHFINSFFLTAHFSEEDYPFDWLMHWLAKQPAWHRSREFETTTCSGSSHALWKTAQYDADQELWGDQTEEEANGKPTMKVVFRPTFDTTHTIFFKGHWLRVRRTKNHGTEMLSISVVARSNTILKSLVLQAKREYEQDSEHRIQIYFADSHGSFRWTDSRHKRPMSSIVLESEVKDMLLNDCRDFLRPESEKWYADRGIPYRRGYLLWGVPGSGKTSSIHAIAGELDLDIYVITLSASWINDATLTNLMGRVPARCILLLEDLDAAFTRSTTRTKKDNGVPNNADRSPPQPSAFLMDADSMPYSSTHSHNRHNRDQQLSDTNTLSLSGLLNSLDGVAASEGRLLFATTNHITRLDPALSRPGRMDVWIEFKNATKWQMESLFMNFFPWASKEAVEVLEREEEALEKERGSSGSGSSSSSSAGTGRRNGTGVFSEEALRSLAKQFAAAIPELEFSVASLQGYLLKHKTSAVKAVEEAAAWVVAERELRERLKREKEEKEREEEKQRQKEEQEERTREQKDAWRRRREEREREKKEEEERKELEEEEKRERERERLEKAGLLPKSDDPNSVATGVPPPVPLPPNGLPTPAEEQAQSPSSPIQDVTASFIMDGSSSTGGPNTWVAVPVPPPEAVTALPTPPNLQ